MTACLLFARHYRRGDGETRATQERPFRMNAPSPAVAPLNQSLEFGRIMGITGSGAVARLFKVAGGAEDNRVTIGRLVGVTVDTSLIVGVVVRMHVSPPDQGDDEAGSLVADIDFMGEIKAYGTAEASFQRGVSAYPTIGNLVSRLGTGDVATIHRIEKGETIEVGRLRLDPTVPAYINFEELLRKHFAVVGTTGVGFSF